MESTAARPSAQTWESLPASTKVGLMPELVRAILQYVVAGKITVQRCKILYDTYLTINKSWLDEVYSLLHEEVILVTPSYGEDGLRKGVCTISLQPAWDPKATAQIAQIMPSARNRIKRVDWFDGGRAEDAVGYKRFEMEKAALDILATLEGLRGLTITQQVDIPPGYPPFIALTSRLQSLELGPVGGIDLMMWLRATPKLRTLRVDYLSLAGWREEAASGIKLALVDLHLGTTKRRTAERDAIETPICAFWSWMINMTSQTLRSLHLPAQEDASCWQALTEHEWPNLHTLSILTHPCLFGSVLQQPQIEFSRLPPASRQLTVHRTITEQLEADLDLSELLAYVQRAQTRIVQYRYEHRRTFRGHASYILREAASFFLAMAQLQAEGIDLKASFCLQLRGPMRVFGARFTACTVILIRDVTECMDAFLQWAVQRGWLPTYSKGTAQYLSETPLEWHRTQEYDQLNAFHGVSEKTVSRVGDGEDFVRASQALRSRQKWHNHIYLCVREKLRQRWEEWPKDEDGEPVLDFEP